MLKGIIIPFGILLSITPIGTSNEDCTPWVDSIKKAQDGAQSRIQLIQAELSNVGTGSRLAVDWNDIRIYGNGYVKSPTPMYLEGIFAGCNETTAFFLNPENINLEKARNHPEKKADLFSIPLGMIQSWKTTGKEVGDEAVLPLLPQDDCATSPGICYQVACIEYNSGTAKMYASGFILTEDKDSIQIASTLNINGPTESLTLSRKDILSVHYLK